MFLSIHTLEVRGMNSLLIDPSLITPQVSTFCTLRTCQNAREMCQASLYSFLPGIYCLPSITISKIPCSLGSSSSHLMRDLVEDQIQRERDIVAYLFPYLSTCRVTFMCLNSCRESHYFFQGDWNLASSVPMGSRNFSLPVSFRLWVATLTLGVPYMHLIRNSILVSYCSVTNYHKPLGFK